jgi:hypothetical protein
MMDWLFGGIADWLKELLIDAIMASFNGMFDMVNENVADIAAQVAETPGTWNLGVFYMVKTLSETIVLPIAGIILTFVMCYELIQLIIEKNNLHEFDTFNIFKWIFKTFIAVFILTNTFNIVLGIFDLAQYVVNTSGLAVGYLGLGSDLMTSSIEAQLADMGVGELLGLLLETQIVKLCMSIMSIIIFVVVFGRMLEIYITMSIAPIPLSTLANRELGQIGHNYLKSLFALAFQGFLIMVCVAIYAVLVYMIAFSASIHAAMWTVAGYTVLLCFMLFKTGSIAKSIFQAH